MTIKNDRLRKKKAKLKKNFFEKIFFFKKFICSYLHIFHFEGLVFIFRYTSMRVVHFL